MSTFLINCSNLKRGGGVQVADSVCCQLQRHSEHQFVVVLSSFMGQTQKRLEGAGNVVIAVHDITNSLPTLLLGRDKVLDGLVKHYNVDGVITIFGPSRWNPRVPHLSGFAMPHCVLPESPYFTRMRWTERLMWCLKRAMLTFYFRRSTQTFWTENPYISDKLAHLLGGSHAMGGVIIILQIECLSRVQHEAIQLRVRGAAALSIDAERRAAA